MIDLTPRSAEADFARLSHYVPQSYLRRWSPGGNRVWSYRLLVPQTQSPVWKFRSIRGIGVRRDLYTSIAEGKESDEIERWLNRDVEDPALPVLDRLCAEVTLSPVDRKKLARYVASLYARSPIYYDEHTRTAAEFLETQLKDPGELIARAAKKAASRGRTIDPGVEAKKRPSSLVVDALAPSEENSMPALQVRAVVGREMWLESIRRIVDDVSPAFENHDWQIFRPYPGWVWYTSDHPLVRLNWVSPDEYDLKGGLGRTGGDLMLPLSPNHMLHTQIGQPKKHVDVLSLEKTLLLKRLIAENAFRWVVADLPRRNAEWFRPRFVNLQQYVDEETTWSKFHEDQSVAERELRESPKRS